VVWLVMHRSPRVVRSQESFRLISLVFHEPRLDSFPEDTPNR
jgi:hypothetical protein